MISPSSSYCARMRNGLLPPWDHNNMVHTRHPYRGQRAHICLNSLLKIFPRWLVESVDVLSCSTDQRNLSKSELISLKSGMCGNM
eukprot:scaffold17786_cov50-Attheya_sp.AAC.3